MIVNVYDARAAATRADQVRVLNQHLVAYPQDPNVKKVPMLEADAIVIQPGEKKTTYTDGLFICSAISTLSRVYGHPTFADNTIVATMSHDKPKNEKDQILKIKKIIADNKLNKYGQSHAVFVSLAERPGRDFRGDRQKILALQELWGLGSRSFPSPFPAPPPCWDRASGLAASRGPCAEVLRQPWGVRRRTSPPAMDCGPEFSIRWDRASGLSASRSIASAFSRRAEAQHTQF